MAKVLIVDDSAFQLQLATQALTAAGHQVVALPSGDDLGPNLVALMPDVVILDYFLPRMNGRDLYKMIRSDARGQGMLVIFLTGRSVAELRPLFTDWDPRLLFLQKPVDAATLAGTIGRALGGA